MIPSEELRLVKPVWTLQQIVTRLTNWEGRWSQATPIPYAFYNQNWAHLGGMPNFSAFSPAQRAAAARITELVSDICNITFVNVADNGTPPGPGNERIAFHNVNSSTVPYWGAARNYEVQNETPPYGRIYGVDVTVNLFRANQQGGWSEGDSNPRKLMHELLHALGLDHPGDYNGDSANYETQALFQQDSNQYTVMSYWLASVTGADHEEGGTTYYASTPLLFDVAALQYLYGANMATRSGDTVYGFNSNANRGEFNLALHPQAVFTIWDGGGNDTLDLSGYSTPSRIDLNAGAFSDAGGLTGNLSIAFNVVIENAVGGAGADEILGNDAANQLSGGGGGDRIRGAGGFDVVRGESGADIFVFDALADSRMSALRSDGKKIAPDLLADFVSGEDKIDLSVIDAIAATAANDAFTFIGTNAFSGVAGELRIEIRDGASHLFLDVDGDRMGDLEIVSASLNILASDLIL